jgi:hypothetical protein
VVYRSQHLARVSLIQRLRGKLWAAPGGPFGIPSGEVQICDLSGHEQAYWSTGAACDKTAERMAAELGDRLDAAMGRRRADIERRIFLTTAHAFPVDAITRNA